MPGRDGTGPLGLGPLTGRGLGPCGRGLGFRRFFGRGRGLGLGLGFGRVFGVRTLTKEEEKEILKDELKILEEEIAEIKKRLKELK